MEAVYGVPRAPGNEWCRMCCCRLWAGWRASGLLVRVRPEILKQLHERLRIQERSILCRGHDDRRRWHLRILALVLVMIIGALGAGLEDAARSRPASAADPGFITSFQIGRYPDGYPDRAVYDKVVFTTDLAGSLLIQEVGAPLGSRWTWRYDFPGPDARNFTCWYKLAAGSDPQNPTGVPAYINNCTPTGVIQVFVSFPGGCPCDLGYFFGPPLSVAGEGLDVGSGGFEHGAGAGGKRRNCDGCTGLASDCFTITAQRFGSRT